MNTSFDIKSSGTGYFREARRLSALLATFLIGAFVLFAPQTAKAQSAESVANTIRSYTPGAGGSGSFQATVDGNVVTVTGTVSNARWELKLNYSAPVVVDWKATMVSNTDANVPNWEDPTGTSDARNIMLSGTGEFKVSGNGRLQRQNTAYAVVCDGSNPITLEDNAYILGGFLLYGATVLTVKGNAQVHNIWTAYNRAIHTTSPGCKVIITESGSVTATANDMTYVSPTIHMDNSSASSINVEISGNGKVIQNGNQPAIVTSGGVRMDDNADVSAKNNAGIVLLSGCEAIINGGKVESFDGYRAGTIISDYAAPITIGGNAKVIQTNSAKNAIYTLGNVIVEGNAEVKASNVAIHIPTQTWLQNGSVTMSGGTVESTANSAIFLGVSAGKVSVSGGTVKGASAVPVINLNHASNTALNVEISGDAQIIQTGMGRGIQTFGGVQVADNADISVGNGAAIYLGGTGTTTVSGGRVISTLPANGINTAGNNIRLLVTGGSVSGISIADNAVAYCHENAVGQFPASPSGTLIKKAPTPTDPYFLSGTNDGLTVVPAGTATWAINAGASGVNYTGASSGFLAIPGVTVLTASTYSVSVYPQPINGQILVERENSDGTFSTVDISSPIQGIVNLRMTAIPDTGYDFDEWEDGTHDNPRLFGVLTENVVISAKFKSFEYKLDFEVTDENNEAISDATVIFNGAPAVGYAVDGVLAGSYSYAVSKDGYFDTTGQLTVNHEAAVDGLITVPVTLMKKYSVVFAARDQSGNPIADLNIIFDGEPLTGNTVTDIRAGTYEYTVSKTGYAEVTDELTVNATTADEDGIVRVTLTLEKAYTVTFTVTDQDDDSIADYNIVFDGKSITGNTIEGLKAGAYEYTVSKPGYIQKAAVLTVNDMTTVDGILNVLVKLEKIPGMFTVTFMVDDEPYEVQAVAEGDTATEPEEPPVKDGYVFAGWYLDDVAYDFDEPVTEDVILTAEWTPEEEQEHYVVTFVYNDGATADRIEYVLPGEKAPRPADPIRTAYKFEGWYLGMELFDFDTPIHSDLKLMAQWSRIISGTETVFAPDLNLYPNPFVDHITITDAEGCILRVFTLTGTPALVQKIENAVQVIHLQHLPKGVYFFRIEKNQQMKTLKAVKE